MNAYQRGQAALCGDYYQYTPTGASRFKQAGRWTLTPSRGHVAFFYSSSLKRISHTGIVTWATRNADETWNIETIEGNTSSAEKSRNGGECRRKMYYNQRIGSGAWFDGFGIPVYGAETCSTEAVIEVAESQIGYKEKASAKDLEDFDANQGSANYTKYSAFAPWFSTPAQWCAQFVSWCFYQACAAKAVSGWIWQDDGSWMYRKTDGQLARDEWQLIDGRWHAFLHDGRMVTGWFKSGGSWYYMAEDGGMCSQQWIQYKGKNYYLTSSGAMATDAYVREEMPYAEGRYLYYWVGPDGAWQPSYDTDKPDLKKYELAR